MAEIANLSGKPTFERRRKKVRKMRTLESFGPAYVWGKFRNEFLLKQNAEKVVVRSQSFTSAHNRKGNHRKLRASMILLRVTKHISFSYYLYKLFHSSSWKVTFFRGKNTFRRRNFHWPGFKSEETLRKKMVRGACNGCHHLLLLPTFCEHSEMFGTFLNPSDAIIFGS